MTDTVAREIDRLSLVIESAVRAADPEHHEAVVAALKTNREALSGPWHPVVAMSTSFPYLALARRFKVPYAWVLYYVDFLDTGRSRILARAELTKEQQLIVFETRGAEMARRRDAADKDKQ